MTRTRAVAGVLGLVLAAVLVVVWILPTVNGPSLECRDIEAEACGRVWRAAAAEHADGLQGLLHLPVTQARVIGPEECPQVDIYWALGGVLISCN